MAIDYTQLTEKQKKKLKRLAGLMDRGNVEVLDFLFELEEKMETSQPDLNKVLEAVKGQEGKQGFKGDKGDKGDKGEQGTQGKEGLLGPPGPQGNTGRDGVDGIDGVGLKGQDGSPDTPEQIVDKLNTLEQVIEKNVIIGLEEEIGKLRAEIRSKPSQMTGMRKVPIVRAINLTDQVDGIVTTYTLPSDTVKVLAVFSSQFPVIFDGANDFSFAGRTLTLNTGVVQSGQTLNCLTEALFYSK